LSYAVLKKLRAKDGDVVNKLFLYALAEQDSTKIPAGIRTESDFEEEVLSRYRVVGSRLALLVISDEAVQWGQSGVFFLTDRTGDKYQAIEHRPTKMKVQVPAEFSVDSSWSVTDLHLEERSCLTDGKHVVIKLKQYFQQFHSTLFDYEARRLDVLKQEAAGKRGAGSSGDAVAPPKKARVALRKPPQGPPAAQLPAAPAAAPGM
jgi:hypothetical protein